MEKALTAQLLRRQTGKAGKDLRRHGRGEGQAEIVGRRFKKIQSMPDLGRGKDQIPGAGLIVLVVLLMQKAALQHQIKLIKGVGVGRGGKIPAGIFIEEIFRAGAEGEGTGQRDHMQASGRRNFAGLGEKIKKHRIELAKCTIKRAFIWVSDTNYNKEREKLQ